MTKRFMGTDKNGTKYYQEDQCPKCGGSGYIPFYHHVDCGRCFKCDGTGLFVHTIKEYTPEYLAKKQKEAEVLSDGKVLFSTSLETDAISKLTGFSSYAKGASLTIFENGSAVTGLIGDGSLSAGGWTFDSIREAVNGEIKVREDSVKIAAVTLDYATGKVHLFVDAEVAMSLAGKTLSQIYAITPGSTKTVSIKIFRKASLAQAAWVLVDTKTASIGADAVEVTVDTGIGPADIQSGFYKVEVCE